MGQHKSLLVGFGGTGGKALKEFAVKISEDYEASKRALTDFAFLLCDTDTQELETNKQGIEEALNPILKKPPIIYTLSLAGALGDRRFGDEAERILGRKENVHERIHKSWWFTQTDGRTLPEPFLARSLTAPVTQGAGQCPMVSFFLSWAMATDLERRIDEIVNDLQNRSESTERQNLTVSTHLIAGLSGGTGRGCWPVIGLKIYERLKAKGFMARPRGIFVDASVYSDIMTGGGGSQYIKQQVNSLTGTSELVAWLRNNLAGEDARGDFALPDFKIPADHLNDKVSLRLVAQGEPNPPGGPVDQAFLITNESKSGRANSEKIISMIATTLYAQVTQDSIGRTEVNETTRPFGSVGAATYFVPATRIRNYLETLLKARCAHDLVSVKESNVNAAVSKVRSIFKLRSSSDKNSAGDTRKSLTQLLNTVSPTDETSVQDEFVKALSLQKLSIATDFVTGLKQTYSQASSKEIAKHITNILHQLVGEDFRNNKPIDIIQRELLSACDGLSLAEMIDPMNALIGELNAMLKDCTIKSETGHTSVLLEKIGTLFPKKVPVFGKNFDEAEIKNLKGDIGGVLKEVRGPAVGAAFGQEIKNLISPITSWRDVLTKFVNELSSLAGSDGGSETHKKLIKTEQAALFTIDDGKSINSGHELFKQSHIIDRQIKPVITEKMLQDLLSTLAQESAELRKIKSDISALAIKNSIANSGAGTGFVANHENLLSLVTQLRNNIKVNPEQIAERFGFCNVVETLVEYWVNGLNQYNHSQRDTDDLLAKFREFFGYKLEKNDSSQKYIKPELIDVLDSMVVSLASTCDPFIRFRQETRGHDTASVFLPKDDLRQDLLGKLATDRLGLRNKDKGNQAREKVVVDAKAGASSPFALIAYAPVWIDISQGPRNATNTADFTLEDVTSLNYWKSSAELTEWLEHAENPSGRSLFYPPPISYGYGYVWPGFVRDKKWREMRWRPWAANLEQNAVTAQKHEAQRHLEAAIWGLTMLSSNHFEKINADVEGISAIENTYRDTEALQSSSMNSVFIRKIQNEYPEFCKQPLIMGPCLTGDPWQITRNAMTEEEGRVGPGSSSEDRMPGKKSYSSLRQLISEFKSEPNIATRFMKEREMFEALLARDEEYPASARQQFRLWLLLRTRKLLDAEQKRVEVLSNKETLTPVVKQLIDVVSESIQTLEKELSTK